MLVVSNTSPMRYLIEINASDVLPRIYSPVYTTPQVLDELRLGHFPDPVRKWALHPASWLQVRSPRQLQFTDILDDGEASAISLACELHASVVLIDERLGRELARSVGLEPRGTLGVIAQAAALGYLDFEAAVKALTTQTRFRHTSILIDSAREHYEALRRQRP